MIFLYSLTHSHGQQKEKDPLCFLLSAQHMQGREEILSQSANPC